MQTRGYPLSEGDTVIANDGEPGYVISVGADCFSVEWDHLRGRQPIVYPETALGAYIRKAFPWELGSL